MNYFLAVDGGGTKTDVLCADESGQVVGTGSSGPTNLTVTSVGAASFNLLEAIRQATENLPSDKQFVRMVMGLAGMDTKKEHDTAYSVFKSTLAPLPIKELVLVNDSIIALANGSDAHNRMVLISGTGTICFGQNAAGATARTSGMDYLLTDQGSGYYIGRQVLREAVKSYDGRCEKSVLEELVCEHFHIASISDLKDAVYNPPLDKHEIAELSAVCSRAFERDDARAKIIFQHAAEELCNQATTVARRLEFATQQFDCVFAGSVMKVPVIKESVIEKIRTEFPGMQPQYPENPPVYGALKLAKVAQAIPQSTV